ncbi:MAG: hypothetical protein WCB12_04590 [Bryobacteraceae bacterium]
MVCPTSLRKPRRTADSLARRKREFHAAKRLDMPPDRFSEIEPASALRAQSGFQDFTRLLFHGRAVPGRSQPQF